MNEDLGEILLNEGFTPFDIDTLDKETILSESIFENIFSIENHITRTRLVLQLQDKAKELGIARNFDKMLKAYQTDYAQKFRQKGSNIIKFTNPPLENLKCGKWMADDTGITKIEMSNFNPVSIMACPHPLLPVERLINVDTDTEKIKISFLKDNRWQSITVDRSMVANKSNIILLADRGVEVTSDNAKELVSYIADVVSLNMKEIPVSRSTDHLGWIGEEFAPYTNNLKYDGDIAYKDVYESVKSNGDYAAWKEHMKQLRKESKIMHILLAASFASPLLNLIGSNCYCIHVWGGTGTGKTVALMVAMSIWGNPAVGKLVRTLNSTQVALARCASFLHNIPFAGDELQIIKSKWNDNFDNLIMYLAEGIDRGRGKAFGGLEIQSTWNNVFLFTGEEPITRFNSGGGVKNRVIEMQATSKLINDGNFTSNFVKENYGFAGKEFIDNLPGKEELQARYREIFQEITKSEEITDKQAMAISTILLADEISTDLIFKDEKLTYNDLKDYISTPDDVEMANRAYDLVIDWITLNNNRFKENEIGETWGKLDVIEGTCLINKTILNKMLSDNGINFEAVKGKWFENGILIKSSQGRYVHQTKAYSIRGNYIKIKMIDVDNAQEDMPF